MHHHYRGASGAPVKRGRDNSHATPVSSSSSSGEGYTDADEIAVTGSSSQHSGSTSSGDFKFARISDGDTYAYTLKKPIKRIPLSENIKVEATPTNNSPKSRNDSANCSSGDENPMNSKDSKDEHGVEPAADGETAKGMATKMSKLTANLGYYNVLRNSQQAPVVAEAPEPNVPVRRACRSAAKAESVDTSDRDNTSDDFGTMYPSAMPDIASKQMLDMDLMIDDEDMALLARA